MDDIRVDGKRIESAVEHLYFLLNKPIGYVTTVRDRHAAHTVMELLKGVSGRVYPVGRLDADSAGLLILSNDGDFTQKLTHPSHQVEKTYRAVVRGQVSEFAAADLHRGVLLDDGMTAPAIIEWVDYDEANNATIVDVTIHEGRNRQVRRMFEAVGYPVLALTRMRIGPIELKGLAPGSWRKLHPNEIKSLLSSADSTPVSKPQKPLDEPAETLELRGARSNRSRAVGSPVKEVVSPARDRASRRPADTKRDKAGTIPKQVKTTSGPIEDERWTALRAEAQELAKKLGRDRKEDETGGKRSVAKDVERKGSSTRPFKRKPRSGR